VVRAPAGRSGWAKSRDNTRMTYVKLDNVSSPLGAYGFFTDSLEGIEEVVAYVKNLIGPKPEPVQEPKFPTPWTSDGSNVLDANRKVVVKVQYGGYGQGEFSANLPLSERYELAAVIAKAVTEFYKAKAEDSDSPF
jgi:hypothetical protein